MSENETLLSTIIIKRSRKRLCIILGDTIVKESGLFVLKHQKIKVLKIKNLSQTFTSKSFVHIHFHKVL